MKPLCYNKEWITSKNEKHNFNKLTMIKIRFRDKKKCEGNAVLPNQTLETAKDANQRPQENIKMRVKSK